MKSLFFFFFCFRHLGQFVKLNLAHFLLFSLLDFSNYAQSKVEAQGSMSKPFLCKQSFLAGQSVQVALLYSTLIQSPASWKKNPNNAWQCTNIANMKDYQCLCENSRITLSFNLEIMDYFEFFSRKNHLGVIWCDV